MPQIKKSLLELLKVNKKEYEHWCIDNDKNPYSSKTIKWFTERVLSGNIVRDLKQNKLVNKHIMKDDTIDETKGN